MDFIAIYRGIRAALSIRKIIKKGIYYWNYCVHKPVKVLVLGSSGSGKTQFLNSLLGIPMLEDNRTQVPKSKYYIFENGRKIEFVDLPGHVTLRPARNKFMDEITTNKIKGIINVVNYGYNDVEENDVDVFKTGENEIKAAYLRDNRKNELNQLSEWLVRIHSDKNNKLEWIITIINKADIWYSQKDEVKKYYEEGEYANEFVEVKR